MLCCLVAQLLYSLLFLRKEQKSLTKPTFKNMKSHYGIKSMVPIVHFSFSLRSYTFLKKNSFLDFSGVFWRQLNCSNLFPESSLLRKNQWLLVLGYKKCRNFSLELEKFCIQRLEGTDLFSLFRENSRAPPCYFQWNS